MRTLIRTGVIILFCLALSIWAVIPPEKKLRKGKDLAGGISLLYGVDVKPGESDVVARVIEVVKERLDPNGVLDLSIVAKGRDRIEITMPLPDDRVKRLRADFEQTLEGLSSQSVSAAEFDTAAALEGAARDTALGRLAAGDAQRLASFKSAAAMFDHVRSARAKVNEALGAVNPIKKAIADLEAAKTPSDDPQLVQWKGALDAAQLVLTERINEAAPAEIAYEAERDRVIVGGLTAGEVRRVVQLSDRPVRLAGANNTLKELPSPRDTALKELRESHPSEVAKLDAALASWEIYRKERRALDDPQDIVRMLKGAGVLNFRITADPGQIENEAEARNLVRIGGPKAYRSDQARWYKINKIENWVDSVEDLESLLTPEGASAFFLRMGYVVEKHKGEYFMLCWDRKGLRLTENEGTWSVASASTGQDQVGRPAIDFRMDALGADKLGTLTGDNEGKKMAVLLDDEVYTAPRLLSRISNSGQITGSFSTPEREYVIRVLSAGSLQAKLSPEPISQSVLGPQFGADNLQKGFKAGAVSFIVVAAFMISYYFLGGLIAVVALAFNALLLVAAMSLNSAAFTLPGIAGIMLTFGQAVDANVLIYERMREELRRGADLRTAVRLGFDKALSAIVDGNVSTLIVCVVLGLTGSQEIKGFALTLGIGVVTTLFAQLVFTRFVFDLLVEKLHIRKMRMLPMVIPGFQEAITPSIDWLKIRNFSVGISILLTVASVGIVWYKGKELLSSEFRGGTTVTIDLKEDPAHPGQRLRMLRQDVQDRVEKIAAEAPESSQLQQLKFAEIVTVNPDPNNLVSSSRFTIKTLVTNASIVQSAIAGSFSDVLELRQPITFEGSSQRSTQAPAFPVVAPLLGESIDRPTVTTDAAEFVGGLVVVLDKLSPPQSVEQITTRLQNTRNAADFVQTQGRRVRVVSLEGPETASTSAAVLVAAEGISYFDSPGDWETELRDVEWRLVNASLTQAQTLASVESFSPSVAATFRAEAIVALLLSTLLVVIYVWVRFDSLRYSLAAIVTTLHDCVIALGFVALASILHDHFPQLAATLGILPFKIDLNVIAAILTILGFSLNGVIVVMDRVRENRGKLPYASRHAVNSAINQTFSRSIITTGTTLFAVVVLYVMGGDAVRVFAYTLLVGVISATYSAIGVAPTLVWVRSADRHADETESDVIRRPPSDGTARLASSPA